MRGEKNKLNGTTNWDGCPKTSGEKYTLAIKCNKRCNYMHKYLHVPWCAGEPALWSYANIHQSPCWVIFGNHHQLERWCKNTNAEFSRINGGGSTSAMSTCWIDLEMSSTENGMLHHNLRQDMNLRWSVKRTYMPNIENELFNKRYLESSSNKKELLTALLESSVIITLILEITYQWDGNRNHIGKSGNKQTVL